MRKLEDYTSNGVLDLGLLLQDWSFCFSNMNRDDCLYVIGECREVIDRIESSYKTECFRVYGFTHFNTCGYTYFTLEEEDIMKNECKKAIDNGNYHVQIDKIELPKELLNNYVEERKLLKTYER